MTVTKGPWSDVRQGDFLSGGEPPNGGGMDPRVDRLERVVERCETDLTDIKVTLAGVSERLKHVPTKAQLLGWGLTGAVLIVAALWGIIGTLLAANNAQLASEIVKSIAK
ncbi:hypothetical protein [Luteibacter sp. SG786]|uniref:hypothetical protein n=1 Tax=Luteibacter sp. SG786 TaxID=2587130 RepID=UPI001423BC51|nr:hypothetical protein [Luteibacter sp. SG786]NII53554.1 hypothetical protein [Luteibacter sp. SG786]